MAGLTEHDDTGISDRCNQPFRIVSVPVLARTGIHPDGVLLDPALQRIADRRLRPSCGRGKSGPKASTGRL
jgi:hypothetical protein